MKIAISFDVEPDIHTGSYKGIYEGIPRAKNLLDKHGIKGTFFTTCDCIERYPEIFQTLKNEGHEIALHGYLHERFDDLSFKDKEGRIEKSLTCFWQHLKERPRGFRSPQHSVDKQTIALLDKYGFKYDSSLTPLNALQILFFPKRLKSNFVNFFSNPRKHRIMGDLIEIPTSSLLIPCVSLVFRVLPRFMTAAYLRVLGALNKEIVFYAHSWDFIELKESKTDRTFSHNKFIKNLDYILGRLKKKSRFVKMSNLI